MDRPHYNFSFNTLNEYTDFEFYSIGNKGTIKKIIRFIKIDLEDFYSLSLFDVFSDGTLSVMSESKNGDMKIVLATVAKTIEKFLELYPTKKVFFSGSTHERTRLYRIAITQEIENIKNLFDILGITEDGLEIFAPNRPYQGFIISLKAQ
ncbi:hypothetical protein LV89_04857 [Arcicella aurantiaca]|uniref:Uncharacterized protein n=1 Tax=Arcicella aurantiaca TaxID=591202 RepID=A0A316DEK5_9BACT|nr:hypothetical protein [Arcicella aurantiaca]PWK16641.1 hypothetical protein LV89_04857 [Arcicella aurantiaca]